MLSCCETRRGYVEILETSTVYCLCDVSAVVIVDGLNASDYYRVGDALAATVRPQLENKLVLRVVLQGHLPTARRTHHDRPPVSFQAVGAPLHTGAAPELVFAEGRLGLDLPAREAAQEPVGWHFVDISLGGCISMRRLFCHFSNCDSLSVSPQAVFRKITSRRDGVRRNGAKYRRHGNNPPNGVRYVVSQTKQRTEIAKRTPEIGRETSTPFPLIGR